MANVNDGFQLDRRTFLKGVAATTAAATPLSSLAAAECDGAKSCVAKAERDVFAKGEDADRKDVKKAVDVLVMKLSGKGNVDEAWRTFVSPKEVVAVKFNGLFRRASTSPSLVWAVCRGLVDAGHAEDKILVVDWRERDYKTAGVKPFDDMPNLVFKAADSAWDGEVMAGPVKTRLTKVLTQEVDAIINLPRLKHHIRAGVTVCMKNHLGSVANPRDFHDKIESIAELNMLAPIAKKTRLGICDAMIGILDRGPQYGGKHCTWPGKSLLASTDVVALDAVGADMIEKARRAKGAGTTRPRPVHVPHAQEIGLGMADLKKISVVKV